MYKIYITNKITGETELFLSTQYYDYHRDKVRQVQQMYRTAQIAGYGTTNKFGHCVYECGLYTHPKQGVV